MLFALLALLFSCLINAQQLAAKIILVDRITNLKRPWGAEFLPDGRLLVSEMEGTLLLYDNQFNLIYQVIAPADLDQRRIARYDNSGAFDVVVDPDFANNGFIYWSYTSKSNKNSFLKVSRLKLVKSVIKFDREIFSATPANSDRFHYGGALLFDSKNNLLIATGERFSSAKLQGNDFVAQNQNDKRGKIWSIIQPAQTKIGKPFKTSLIASGLRNVQSMTLVNKNVWLSDHGPIKGDELNLLTKNANYGWPYRTKGQYKDKDYQPNVMQDKTFTPPVYTWEEFTMAPSGLLYYQHKRYPQFSKQLLVSGLSSGRLLKLDIQGDRILDEVQLVLGIRQRDVLASPDGRIFILSDETQGRMIEIIAK